MLLDEIAKIKAEIAEREKEGEDKEEKFEEVEDVDAPSEEIAKEEVEAEPEVKPEIKEEKKEEPLDNAGYARLRREAAAEKRRAELLEKEVEELRKAKEVEHEGDEQADPIQLPPELESVIQDHRMARAERDFTMFENKVKQQHPEYGSVASEYTAAMYQAIKLQNQQKSDFEISEMTKKAILLQAAEYARAGHENPVEEMYHRAKELGFTGKSFQKPEVKEEVKEEKIQPDMRKVAENRKRSAGMAANNGLSEGLMTLGAANDLPAIEWVKLPISERRRLMYGD